MLLLNLVPTKTTWDINLEQQKMSKNMAPTNDKLINEINYLKVLLRLRNYNYTIKIWDTWKYDLSDTLGLYSTADRS